MTTRRKVLRWLASVSGLGATAAWATDEETLHRNRNELLRLMLTRYNNSTLKITRPPTIDDEVCILTQQQVEGPFHVSAPMRVDVTDGKKGVPFELAMQIVSADGCTPVAGVIVEIWHCDAEGNYSAHPEMGRDVWSTLEYVNWDLTVLRIPPVNDDIFLRGAQKTDDNGIVRFRTIFPGWYEMRAPHIHFKIGGPQGELFTSQFYFDDATANEIYREHEAYSPYGESPYNANNDFAIALLGGAEGLLLDARPKTSGAMHASARVGIELPNA